MNKADMFNQSGCRDMTAYLALLNIEREEQDARMHKPGYRRKMRRSNKKRPVNADYTSHRVFS